MMYTRGEGEALKSVGRSGGHTKHIGQSMTYLCYQVGMKVTGHEHCK